MKKPLVLAFVLISFAALVSADDVQATYGDDHAEYTIKDANRGYHYIKLCGEVQNRRRNRFSSGDISWSIGVPEDAPCDLGESNIYYRAGRTGSFTDTGDDITVYHKGGGSAHVGEFKLFFGMNKGPKNIADFFITDEFLYNTPLIEPDIILHNYNRLFDERAQATAKYGVPVGSGDNDLSKIVDECSWGDTSSCDMQNIDFTTEVSKNYHNSVNLDHSNIKPIHKFDGSYWPDGEIIYARFANYSVTSSTPAGTTTDPGMRSEEGPNFYVCRDGATVWNGKDYTGFVVDASESEDSEDLMKCENSIDRAGNKYNFRWESVEECEDGLDNDGDGKIDDGDDPGCTRSSDTSEEGTATTCETGVTRETVRDTTFGVNYPGIVAQYETTDGCSTDGTIYSTDDIVAANLDKDPFYTTCEEGIPYFGGICTKKSWDYQGFGDSTMPVVQYWPTWNYFSQLETADSSIDYSTDVYQTEFVSDYQGWTPKVQSLHEAEKKYWTPYYDICNPVIGTNACQLYTNWEDRIRMPEVEQAYNNSDSSTNIEAWYHGIEAGPYNAGVNVSSYSTQKEVMSKDSSREAVFDGGFAGKCENDQVWQYVKDANRWKCSGDIPWEQTVYLPEFENNDHVGLIFPPYNFKNSVSDLPNYIFEEDPSSLKQLGAGWDSFETAAEQMDFLFTGGMTDVDRVNARCWNGTTGIPEGEMNNSQSYLESNYNVNMTDFDISVPSNPSDPVANFSSLDHGGSYSCYWNVTTVGGDTVSDIQDFVNEMHNHLGKSSPSSTEEIVTKNITEDSSYASDLPDMTGSDHTWTTSELTSKIGSWN